jgi:hypothetical protein
MALTNLQLEILAQEVQKQIQVKKERFLTSPQGIRFVQSIQKDPEMVKLVKQFNKLLDLRRKKEDAEAAVKLQINEIGPDSYKISRDKDIETFVQKKIDTEVNSLYPTAEEIKAKLILASLQNSSDLIQTVLDEYEQL